MSTKRKKAIQQIDDILTQPLPSIEDEQTQLLPEAEGQQHLRDILYTDQHTVKLPVVKPAVSKPKSTGDIVEDTKQNVEYVKDKSAEIADKVGEAFSTFRKEVPPRLEQKTRWLKTPGGIGVPLTILLVLFIVMIPINGFTRIGWLWNVIAGNARVTLVRTETPETKTIPPGPTQAAPIAPITGTGSSPTVTYTSYTNISGAE